MQPHLWKSTLIFGLASVALGVLVLAWPGISVLVAAIAFGVYLIGSGIAQVFFALGMHVSVASRVLLFVSGAASLVLALLAFRYIGTAVLLLAVWIGIGLIFRGAATAVSGLSGPLSPGRGWNIVLGLIILVGGVVIMVRPFKSILAVVFVVGIWLLVIGVFEVISSFAIRKASRRPGR
ncbi:HdeD family acid-resistance protein [Mycobacterium genavense]|uniref:HdeD family acid-resistance protein n=1 Tax=Mycobacterium genavense TaxID=36812 RepID=UPI000472C7C0|nr:HdeD family acid-resistance protein [Mycobacterium genavense]